MTSKDDNNIKLSVFLHDATAYVDNIYIYDKFYSKVQNDPITKSYSVTSPNFSSIDIIWYNKNENPMSITWFDQYGNKITEHTGGITNIDCSSWPAGMYFYHIEMQNKNYQGKVVVVK